MNNHTTNTKLAKSGLTILSVISFALTFKFCYDIGLDAGWPVAWGLAGIAFELIKCSAVKSGLMHFQSNFNRGAIAAVLAGLLMIFSGAASFNVLSSGLSGHASHTNERLLIERQLTDLNASIAAAKQRAAVLVSRDRVTKAQHLTDTEIKPAQEKLYAIQSQLNNFKADFIGDNAVNISLFISVMIEVLALYCAFELFASNLTDSEYKNNNQKYAKYNNNIEPISEYNPMKSGIDHKLYSDIKADILDGYARPTHADLRRYQLGQEEIRLYLAELAQEGVIYATGERSLRYHLS